MKITSFAAGVPLMLAMLAGGEGLRAEQPDSSAAAALASYIQSLRLIDVHEHLYIEQDYRKNPPDNIFALFYPSAYDDLISAGMPEPDWQIIMNPAFPLSDRWALFAPYWQRIRNTGFGHIPLIIAKDLYGIDDINDSTYAELNRRMAACHEPGWYRRVLRDNAGIEMIVEDMGSLEFDRSLFRHVLKFDHLLNVRSSAQLEILSSVYHHPVAGLDDYLAVIDRAVADGVRHGMVGIKMALAYERSLQVDRVAKESAEEILQKVLQQQNGSPDLPAGEIKPLQDYLIFHLCGLAVKHNMPVQIHTGFQAWLRNDIRQADPIGLIPLFQAFPGVRFSLLHGSYPYGDHLAVLAKQYPNVYIDLSWLYAISPSFAERYLHEWIETIPGNKIMAFGGDYFYPEQSYAESKIARKVITKVLVTKMEAGYLSYESATFLAAALLRDNGIRFFGLKKITPEFPDKPVIVSDPVIRELVKSREENSGLVTHWLAAGPFDLKANVLNQVTPPPGFLESYAPERSVDPVSQISQDGAILSWLPARADARGYLDFTKVLGNYGRSIGYAYTEIISSDDRQVVMAFGSSDGLKIWVNGMLVHDRHGLHKARRDDVLISVPFRSGTNHLLFKVEHFVGVDWGLYLRVLDPDKALTFKKTFTGFRAGA
ncbi:amidohydrolase family protein [bacterium]|nr:amidohydrolase family protein [bacterium]